MRGIALAYPQLGCLVLVHALRGVIADVAVFSLRPGPTAKFPELHEFRMRRLDMVGLVECLQGDLPVAIEIAPLAPSVAHVLQLEGVEHGGGGLEKVAQGLAIAIHVDPDPAAPGIHVDLAQPGTFVRQRALPVFLVGRVRIRALQVEPPPVVATDELVSRAPGVLGSLGGIHESAAAMRAHVVIGADLVRRRPHDQHRIVENFIGKIIADLGDVLEATGHLPYLAPQFVTLRTGILFGNIGLRGVDHRVRQILSRFDNPDRITHRILPLCDWQTRRCPCATPLEPFELGNMSGLLSSHVFSIRATYLPIFRID